MPSPITVSTACARKPRCSAHNAYGAACVTCISQPIPALWPQVQGRSGCAASTCTPPTTASQLQPSPTPHIGPHPVPPPPAGGHTCAGENHHTAFRFAAQSTPFPTPCLTRSPTPFPTHSPHPSTYLQVIVLVLEDARDPCGCGAGPSELHRKRFALLVLRLDDDVPRPLLTCMQACKRMGAWRRFAQNVAGDADLMSSLLHCALPPTPSPHPFPHLPLALPPLVLPQVRCGVGDRARTLSSQANLGFSRGA